MNLAAIKRLYFITKVMLNYGLDQLIADHRQPVIISLIRKLLFWIRCQHAELPIEQRIRLTLEALGPVFIKFGQMLSTRRDLLSQELADQLTILQDQAPPFCGKQAQKMIEQALGYPINQVFVDFNIVPLASASVAQVHTATLKDSNQEVVLKVIRPDIAKIITLDIKLMQRLAYFLQYFIPDIKQLKPVTVVGEYQKTLINELNMLREAANALQLRHNFADSKILYVPKVYPDYCRSCLLVMERIYGIGIADITTLNAQGINMKLLAERGVSIFFTQVFRDNFFHADMHPGNIFVSYKKPDDPQYIGVDYGIIGTLNSKDKAYLAENFLAFCNRDYRRVAQLHIDSGCVPINTTVEDLESALRTVLEPIFAKPIAEISFGQVLLRLFSIMRQFQMNIQPQLILLQKTLLCIEGLGRQLYPQLDLWQTAKPFLTQWQKEQVSFKRGWRIIKQNIPDWTAAVPELPVLLHQALTHLTTSSPTTVNKTNSLAIQANAARASFYLLGMGSALLVMTVIGYQQLPNWLIAIGAAIGLWCWWCGWNKLR